MCKEEGEKKKQTVHLTNALSLQLGMVGHSAAGEGEEEGVKGFKGTRSVTCKQKKGNNNNNRGGGGKRLVIKSVKYDT